MIEYKSLGIFFIKGRGTVHSVINEKDREFGCPDLRGTTVKIDDVFYSVQAVETFAISHISKGQKIGLLVKKHRTYMHNGKLRLKYRLPRKKKKALRKKYRGFHSSDDRLMGG